MNDPRCFRLHAGAVVHNGRAVVFPGPNGAGKSTLVTRLVQSGYDFLTDDELLIQPDPLRFFPSSRPLLMKAGASHFFPRLAPMFEKVEGTAESWLRPEWIREDCRAVATEIAAIVFLSGRPDEPLLEEVGQSEAMLGLLRECMNFPEFGEAGIGLLTRLLHQARLYRLNRGDLEQSVKLLSEVVIER